MFRETGGQPFNELTSVESVKSQLYPAIIIISRGGDCSECGEKGQGHRLTFTAAVLGCFCLTLLKSNSSRWRPPPELQPIVARLISIH